MNLIVYNDGLYKLIPVTKKMLENVVIIQDLTCFDLCDILRIKLTNYIESLNLYIMNNGSGNLIGCVC